MRDVLLVAMALSGCPASHLGPAIGHSSGKNCTTREGIIRDLDARLLQVDCPVPIDLDRERDYCPVFSIEVLADGTVRGSTLLTPKELKTAAFENCWNRRILDVKLQDVCEEVTIESYTPYCIGWLVTPDDSLLFEKKTRQGMNQ